MKKLLFLILILFVLTLQYTPILYSQWVNIANVNTTQLNSVQFIDQYTGIAVGTDGIWRTINGGYNWTKTLNTLNLNCISFYDINNGFAVGDSGGIFRTVNRGTTWNQLAPLVPYNLNGVSIQGNGFGCIVGDYRIVLRTTNFGISWTINQNASQYHLYCIKMTGETFSYSGGSLNREYLFTTANYGLNWAVTFDNPGYPSLRSIEQFQPYSIVAVGDDGWIRRTVNGGLNWTTTSISSENFNSVVFPDVNTGYICGTHGVIFKSMNMGNNWNVQLTNTQENLKCLSFINTNIGWSVGQNGIVLYTTNGGITSLYPVSKDIPQKFKLYQNYPNPFNPSTKIKFDLKVAGIVSLRIYDVKGCLISELINNYRSADKYEVEFDGTNLVSGVYFYELKIENLVGIKKMVLIK
jgi:photosystem II stability/assembly factor-like uncharacterized protein